MPAKQFELKPNTLYSGDCLEVMQTWRRQFPAGVVDLIYLDPPFNSNQDYNIIFGKDKTGRGLDEQAQFTAFGDTWRYTNAAHERVQDILGDNHHPAHNAIDGLNRIISESPMLAYLSYMADRLVEMHALLRDTGSLYLHCDPTASHYLKIILDDIFGKENFRNEIIWHYNKWTNAAKHFQKNHDVIFFYSKSSDYQFEKQYIITKHKHQVLVRGWDRNVAHGTRQLLVYDRKKSVKQIKMAKAKGMKVVYLDDKPSGVAAPDVWNDVNYIASGAKERLGYRTQKPIALLERIVNTSSEKGDLVLDPFCGCGTTAAAAFNLRRNFLGIDISVYPLNKICKARLKDVKRLKILGLPTDFESAKALPPLVFEQWVVTLMPGFVPNNKQTGDKGVDGRAWLLHKPEGENGLVIAQVKQLKKGSYAVDAQKALMSQILGDKCSMGVFVTLYKMPDTQTKLDNIRAAGSYKLAGSARAQPRLIYWSVEEYFEDIAAGKLGQPPLPEMKLTREEEIQRDLMTE